MIRSFWKIWYIGYVWSCLILFFWSFLINLELYIGYDWDLLKIRNCINICALVVIGAFCNIRVHRLWLMPFEKSGMAQSFFAVWSAYGIIYTGCPYGIWATVLYAIWVPGWLLHHSWRDCWVTLCYRLWNGMWLQCGESWSTHYGAWWCWWCGG